MMATSLLWYVGAFFLALGVLIVVHELGHYLVARWVGVKVLRFSVGFGKPLLSRRFGADDTEWVLAAFPLGGYVKMLDEREEPVAEFELHRAFNRQPVMRRSLVVVAGPVANLLLAVFLYWLLFVSGVSEIKPLLAAPLPGTPAAQAGIENGDLVRQVSGIPVTTLQDFRWQLMKRIADREPVDLEVMNVRGEVHLRTISTGSLDASSLDGDFLQLMGLTPYHPDIPPVIGAVAPKSPAEVAGLRVGDLVATVAGEPVTSWLELVAAIRDSPGKAVSLGVFRSGTTLQLEITPDSVPESGRSVGRIGVGVQDDPELRAKMMVEVRAGPGDALLRAMTQTWDTSIFSLRMVGRMLFGEQSWKNISGPVTIADYAGQSARLGVAPFLKFLALISISLGVLNLLPIPILDGGHLLYYFLEVIKGGPLSERVMEVGQQIGISLLALLMAFAFFNDINRLISG